MAQYKKGIVTNESILLAAKESFRIEGYKSTTIASICRKCDIKLGTFTYYFNKKEDLLQTIYTSYMENCRGYIKSLNLNLKPVENHILVVALYYYNIYTNDTTFNFHKEILGITSMNSIFPNPKAMIEDFAVEGLVLESDALYDVFVKADNAVRREFNLMFFNKLNSIPDGKTLLLNIYSVAGQLFRIDQERIQKAVEFAYNFVKTNPIKDITLI